MFGVASSLHLLGMVNGYHHDQDRLFLQRDRGGLPELIGISGNAREVLSEGERCVGIDEVDTIANLESLLREVAALNAANDG